MPKKKRNTSAHAHHNHHEPAQNEIHTELAAIYADDASKPMALDTITFKPKNTMTRILAVLVFLFACTAAIAWFGYYTFTQSNQFNTNSIRLEMKGPFTATIADEITYDISIVNDSNFALTKAGLEVQVPDGFSFIRASKELSAKEDRLFVQKRILAWDIGTIAQHSSEIITITGTLVHTLHSTQTMVATVNYTPSNFSSSFQKRSEISTQLTTSPITITPSFPAALYPKQSADITLTIANSLESQALKDLSVTLAPPASFALESITVKQGEESNLLGRDALTDPFVINTLTIDTPVTITYTGYAATLSEDAAETKGLFMYDVSLKTAANPALSLASGSAEVAITKGDIGVSLIINGKAAASPINWEEAFDALITVKNNTQTAVQDITIRAVFDSPYIDASGYVNTFGAKIDKKQFLWQPESNALFEQLLPGEEIELPVSLLIKSSPLVAPLVPNAEYTVKSFAEVTIGSINDDTVDQLYETDVITNTINSDAAITAAVRYFSEDGATIGSGPLPPVEGQKTTYALFWELRNTLHDLERITVSATLPAGVTWEGNEQVTTGRLYQGTNNEIIWEISRLPGTIIEASASVAIGLTPQNGDVDKILTIVGATSARMVDSVTRDTMELQTKPLTTNLDFDAQGIGKGLIKSND